MPEQALLHISFWLILTAVLYTMYGYPLALKIALLVKSPQVKANVNSDVPSTPKISFIVAAYNENKNIAAKIANMQQVAYDRNELEFIVGSDGSTDGTDEIIRDAAVRDNRVRYFRNEERGGKIAVLHKAVPMAQGDILIFTDCSVKTDPDIIDIIIEEFADQTVGLISSRDVWINVSDGGPLGQHHYIDFEMQLRRLESAFSSTITASGSFFAVRKELYEAYPAGLADDFALPLAILKKGYRVIHCDRLVGYVPMVKSSGAEFARRTRIILAGIRTVAANFRMLFSLRHPVFAWQIWSHKVLKWLLPFLLLANVILAIVLRDIGHVYRLILIGYAVIILLGMAGFIIKARGITGKLLSATNFLLISIFAVCAAWMKFLFGGEAKTWEPTHR